MAVCYSSDRVYLQLFAHLSNGQCFSKSSKHLISRNKPGHRYEPSPKSFILMWSQMTPWLTNLQEIKHQKWHLECQWLKSRSKSDQTNIYSRVQPIPWWQERQSKCISPPSLCQMVASQLPCIGWWISYWEGNSFVISIQSLWLKIPLVFCWLKPLKFNCSLDSVSTIFSGAWNFVLPCYLGFLFVCDRQRIVSWCLWE